jgi:outer membrane protein OmpA-like peptidoglycan-associated protein
MPHSQLVFRTIDKAVTTARIACWVGIGMLLLSSCSTPPQPPSVDESTRRPVNAKTAVDLRACQGDLSRATLLVSEMARAGVGATALNKALPLTGAARETAARECSAMAGAADSAAGNAGGIAPGNLVAVVPFGVGSAAWSVEQADAAALVRRAKGAALIMIRGRTDAAGDSLQQTALARRRAEAAADFLQQAGVPKDKLRLTWQGAGDPVAGLRPAERAQSRRVEIEFYTAAPMLVSLRSGAANGKGTAPVPDQARSETTANLWRL